MVLSEVRNLFAAFPWRAVPVAISDPRYPPGCLNPFEAGLLRILARDYFTGEGAIVDAGAFLGKSSALFAQGLRENGRIATRPWIHAFDWFRVVDEHDVRFVKDTLGQIVNHGASTRQLYDLNVQPWADLLQVHEGDFTLATWNGGPIEILFLDICKTPELNARVIQELLPAMIPGRSILIQQDYHHCHHPMIHLSLERLHEYFEPLAARIDDSYVCLSIKEIPSAAIAEAAAVDQLSAERQLALMDAAIERLPGVERHFVQLARVVLLAERFGKARAVAALTDLPERVDGSDHFKWERERAQVLDRIQRVLTIEQEQ